MTMTTALPDEVAYWYDGRADAAASALPFFGPVFAPGDKTAYTPPEEPPAWLQDGPDYTDQEALESALADITGTARELKWAQADLIALAWVRTPRKQRGAVLKRLGYLIGRSARHARRLAKAALVYPPEMRAPDMAFDVYDAALGAADPLAVMEAALANGWNRREVLEHIATDEPPTVRETLVDEDYPPDVDAEDAAALVHKALALAQADGRALLELRVRVVAVWAGEEQAA